MTASGQVLVQPRYRSISYYSGGLACFELDGLYGYIDSFGTQVIAPVFEDARAFTEGLAAVKLKGKWGYIRPDGSAVIAHQFICERGMAGPFRDGLARVGKNGRWGHINREGEFVYSPRFDMAYELFEDRAAVILAKRSGYIDRKGETVVPPNNYRRVDNFSEGRAAVNTGSGQAHNSVADACEIGFINNEGEFVIPPRFLAAGSFHNHLCLVETEKKIAYVDRRGNSIWESG